MAVILCFTFNLRLSRHQMSDLCRDRRGSLSFSPFFSFKIRIAEFLFSFINLHFLDFLLV